MLFSFQNIVNIFVILGGVSAFIIYATQRRASVKSAFTMVINQIDGIEEVISKLRSTQADGKLCNEEVFKSDQILSRNFWSEYKHLIMRQLDQTDIKILDEFFIMLNKLNWLVSQSLRRWKTVGTPKHWRSNIFWQHIYHLELIKN
ncbi:hypothetical protein M5E87_16185 [Flavonifractor plautii]|nr:hypothetical protein M5E87_16185 [Flavonifractor plautii]